MDKKRHYLLFTFQRLGQALLKDYSFNGGGYVTIAEIFFLLARERFIYRFCITP